MPTQFELSTGKFEGKIGDFESTSNEQNMGPWTPNIKGVRLNITGLNPNPAALQNP